MAKLASIVLALAASAGALVAPPAPKAATRLSATEGASAPLGFWDPAGLSELGSERTQAWFKAAETKHGRVAMAAFLGCVATGLGVHWPGVIDASGTTFASLGEGHLLEAWDKMPFDGKQQIVAAIGGIESVFEAQKPHYLTGGVPGKVRLTGSTSGVLEAKYDAATLKKKRDAELANGRLAMLGMAAFIAGETIPGSVPALSQLGFAGDYAGGLPFAPF
mmetsp:Transcript_6616/g.20894  ORF Transcript_6616/g.20894 Transcript_6616/m.20894 type:complete len:220 (-) Transcript_6616:46-705(-)